MPAWAEQAARAATQQKVRVTGVVRDESNAITLPGIPVEVVGTGQTVYTDVDGRYVLDLAAGQLPAEGDDGGLPGEGCSRRGARRQPHA